jgi:thioesterase domain-containing protein/acyl carrier protein
VPRGAAGDRLVAYHVPEGAGKATPEELRGHLAERLPEHMVPDLYVELEALPLNPAGKVDRAALPAPEREQAALEPAYLAPRDELEAKLAEIWREVLELDSVGVRDDFFQLGGHSLLAVRLASELEKMLGRKFPVATLFQAPTIEQLATLIRTGADLGKSLVPIRPAGDGRRLYWTHPASGNVFTYQELSRELHESHGFRFFGFQAQGLDGESAPYDRVEDMAAHYVDELLEADPEGPYHLSGWSMGGVLAYEMAQQLRARGAEVAVLALLDTRVPDPQDRAILNDELLVMRLFANDFGISLTELGLSQGDLLAFTEDERFSFVFEKAQEAGTVPPNVDPAQIRRLYRVFKATARAIAAYEPEPYPGPILFVRSKEPMPVDLRPDADWLEKAAGKGRALARSLRSKVWERLMKPALGWEKHCDAIEVVETTGNHFEILRPPHVERLARLLADKIRGNGEEPSE